MKWFVNGSGTSVRHSDGVTWTSCSLKSPVIQLLFLTPYADPHQTNIESALLALCKGNSPVTGEFPAQRASNAVKASIWWRHNEYRVWLCFRPAGKPVTINVFVICKVRVWEPENQFNVNWHQVLFSPHCFRDLGPLLIIWINFKPGMEEWSHTQ